MNDDIYILLKKEIQNKIGKNILFGKDCVQLSRQIEVDTHRQISSSTIKRFFGIIKSAFRPSKYTLETFAVFLGYTDWQTYLNSYDESKDFMLNTWDSLKKRAKFVTDLSLSSLKQKTAYEPEKNVLRMFADTAFNDFLNADKTATMFIAPSGYGKSTLLIQLLENYFLNEEAEFKNDIVILIDGGIFFNLYSKNSNLNMLSQLLEYKIASSLNFYFQKNPQQRKGRIWTFIDNVDEIFFNIEGYQKLVENLMRIVMANDGGWYKMILTCRPENLDVFAYLTNKNPLLKSCWYGVDFNDDNMANMSNVPPLFDEEIDQVFNKNQFDFEKIKTSYKDVLSIIRIPCYLTLFIEEFKENENVSEIVLLKRCVQRRLNSRPYSEEKFNLIDHFLWLCKLGKTTNSVHKHLLLGKVNHPAAYRQLISHGIIYEYVIPNGHLAYSTYVKFNQSTIFEYILFEKWTSNKQLNVNLFFKIKKYYQNNVQLQCNILKFFVRFLILEKRFEVIKQLHNKLETTIDVPLEADVPPCLRSVSLVVRDAIKRDENCRKNLLPWISRSKIGKVLYKAENNQV